MQPRILLENIKMVVKQGIQYNIVALSGEKIEFCFYIEFLCVRG